MTSKPLPMTKDGFRYYWGEEDFYSEKYKTAENIDILKRLPFTKRKAPQLTVKLSENDRAPQLKLEGDLRVTGEKGYSMVRATSGINRGKFYYEVTVDRMNKENREGSDGVSAARIGWSQRYSNLQAPLGYDKYGYSYRSRFGTKFHQAKGKTYDTSGGYGEGDTIGCMIELPFGNKKNLTEGRHLPTSIKITGAILHSNHKRKDTDKTSKPKMLEEKDQIPQNLIPLPESKISFYKNGRFLGVAFKDIYEGFYYPTISLYKNCTVTVNFGPKFRFPPPQEPDNISELQWRPACHMADIELIDNLLSDMIYVVDQETNPEGINRLEQAIKIG